MIPLSCRAGEPDPGNPIWEVTAFTFGRPRADEPQQVPGGPPVCPVNDYYNQADLTPSFDYELP